MKILAMAGGSRYGAFQLGVARHLPSGYEGFCGVSIGGIHALHFAQYRDWQEAVDKLGDTWGGVTDASILKHHFPLGPAQGVLPCTKATSIYNTSPLRNLIRDNYHGQLVWPVRLGAVSATTLEYKLFDETSPEIVDATIASAAMPMFFEPWEVDGDLYVDGGIRRVTPVRAALDMGATSIDVIINEPMDQKFDLPRPKTLQDAGLRMLQVLIHQVFVADLKIALAYNEIARLGGHRKSIPIRIIQPPEPLPGSPLDFSPEIIQETIAIGEKVGAGLSEGG